MFNGAYGGYDQFGQSNSLIGMFAFILLILLIFMVLLRVGVSILSVIFAPDGSPHLIDGMVPGDSLMVFDQYPGTPGSKTVYRSKNQNGGIEFTWSVWLYIQDVDAKDGNKYRHIFSKGNPQQYATRYNPTGGIDQPDVEGNGMMYPNNAPGLYLAPNSNDLILVMNSFADNRVQETVMIDNIPLNKWVNLIFRCKDKSLDIFINGIVTKNVTLRAPPRQNYENVYMHLNKGYSGYTSNLWYYNYAIGTAAINDIVRGGPNTKLASKGGPNDKTSDYLSSKWYFAGQSDMYNPASISSTGVEK